MATIGASAGAGRLEEETKVQTQQETPAPRPQGGPMRVSFDGNRLEVSASLLDTEAVDRLIKALEANKGLLVPEQTKDDPSAQS